MLIGRSQLAGTFFVAVLVAMILVIDAVTPRGVAIGVLYVVPVLFFVQLTHGVYALRLFLALCMGCIVLVWAGFVISPANSPPLALDIRVTNRLLSSSLIVVATLMSLKTIDPHAMQVRYEKQMPFAFTDSVLLTKSVDFMTQLRVTLTPAILVFVAALSALVVGALKIAGLLQQSFADGLRGVLTVDYTILAALVLLLGMSVAVRLVVGLLRPDKHFWRDLVDLAGWLMVHAPFCFVMVFFSIIAANVVGLILPAAGTWILVFSFFTIMVIEVHELGKYALGTQGLAGLMRRMAAASKIAHTLLSQSVKEAAASLAEEEEKKQEGE